MYCNYVEYKTSSHACIHLSLCGSEKDQELECLTKTQKVYYVWHNVERLLEVKPYAKESLM